MAAFEIFKSSKSSSSQYQLKNPPQDGVSSLRFSSKERSDALLASSWDGSVTLYDTKLDSVRWKQSLEEEVKLISVGPDKDLGVVPQLIAKDLQQMFLKKAWEYKQLGVENPVARALLETKQHFLDEGGDRQNDKGRYYNSSTLGTVGEFKNFENAIFGNNKDL